MGGRVATWNNVEAHRIWDVPQGESGVRPSTTQSNTLVRSWEKQRAAMDTMTRDRNLAHATLLFREALAINPGHEDSHYYPANCLAASGDVPGPTPNSMR